MMKIKGEGVWLVDKPVGISSFGLVAQVRRLTGIRKVGHAGTLDPLAEGLMIILVGKDYTRQADRYLKQDKTYEVELEFGRVSSTGDREGQLQKISPVQPSRDQLLDAFTHFQGEIMQTPPAYSAIKIGGQPAYKLARVGKDVALVARPIKIHRLELIDYHYPHARLVCEVSSGTYIRSLVADIGDMLGTGAYMTALKRTSIGNFTLKDAIRLEKDN